MQMKISFAELQTLKKLNQKEMTWYLTEIYKRGFNDGIEAYKTQPAEGEMDWNLLKIAIKSTEGIGDVLSERIIDTVERICFGRSEKNEVD